MWIGILSIILLVLATAFFVAAEFALVSVRRTRIDQLVSEGNALAKDVRRALNQLNTYLAAAQVGITMATLGLGALGEPVLAQVIAPPLEAILPHEFVEQFISIHGIAFVIALLLVTITELIVGETVPKIWAIQRAEAMSLVVIKPMNLMLLIFKPLIWLINTFSNAILRMIGLPQDKGHETVYSIEELEMLVVSSRQAGVLDKQEEVILRRVFDFGELTARQVMRPRTEVVGVAVDATLSNVISTMLEHKHSRFPVFEGDMDNIVGVLFVLDVFAYLAQTTDSLEAAGVGADGVVRAVVAGVSPSPGLAADQFNVRSLMRPIDAVPETLDVALLLARMQQSGTQMVVVVDEYGGTAGIVTLEDVVEEIVGEVRDEFEPESNTPGIVVTPEGTLVDGLVAIDDVSEALGLKIESESDTVGGYVFEMLGRKPELGDTISVDGFTVRVEELDGLRIARVRVLSGRNGQGQQVPQEQTNEE
jgi:putative hemolysin